MYTVKKEFQGRYRTRLGLSRLSKRTAEKEGSTQVHGNHGMNTESAGRKLYAWIGAGSIINSGKA